MKREKINKAAGILLYVISLGMLAYCSFLATGNDIWYDELFSMEFASRPISEMIKLTAADVHPPLYYIIIHFAASFFGAFGISSVIAAKLAGIIPYLILWIYGVTLLRKRYDTLTGGLFTLAVCSMPNMVEYTTEIRMYGYVILFITAMCIHAAPFLETEKDKQIRGLKWGKAFPIFIYGLLACYTQYYAAVAVFSIYLFLVIWSIRKNIWQLGLLFIVGNLTVILYYPWIGTVISQVGTVSENYWIQDLTWRSLGGVVKYLTLPSFTNATVGYVFAGLMFVMMLVVVMANIRDAYMWLCFFPIVGIVIFGFAASFLIRPFFVYRYMLPGMGALWMGIVYGIYRLFTRHTESKQAESEEIISEKKQGISVRLYMEILPYTFVVIMIIVGIRDFWAFRGNELYRRVNMALIDDLFNELRSDDNLVVITNFDHVDGLVAYYLNDFSKYGNKDIEKSQTTHDDKDIQVLLYGAEPENLIKVMVPGTGMIEDGQEIKELLTEGKRVVFLGSFNVREEIVKDWQDNYGIRNQNKGSYLMERYWFDVFELSPDR